MKIYVDIAKESIIKVDDEQREVYKGDSYVDKMKVYCTSAPTNWYLTLSAKLANGRPTNTIMSDGVTTPVIEDGVTWYLAEFTLSKENSFTLCEGLATFYLKINYTSESGHKVAEKYLGSWQSYIYDTTEFEGNIFTGDPSETINNMRLQIEQLRGLIASLDEMQLHKQDIPEVEITTELDGLDKEGIYNSFYNLRDLPTRGYYINGNGKTDLINALGLANIAGDFWSLQFKLINSNDVFRLVIFFKDMDGQLNYFMEMNSFMDTGYNDTGWIDLNYLSLLKDQDIRHDKEIKDLQGSLLYNNVGLMWVSDFDVKTGNITYLLNPNFDFKIDDSRLEQDGEIDWYVRPKSSLVNKEVE